MTSDSLSYERAMSDRLEVIADRTTVLTVDMQRDYLDLQVASSPVLASEAERVLRSTSRLLELARDLSIPVVHAYSTRRREEVEAGLEFGGLRYILEGKAAGLSQNAQRGPKVVPDRVAGSPQCEVHPELVRPGDLHVPTKKTLDSYQYSDLDLVLGRLLCRDTVILTGVNTDTCVYSTTFSTANRGYRPVVVRDCTASMRGVDRHEMALTLMSRSIAWVVGLAELETKLAASTRCPTDASSA